MHSFFMGAFCGKFHDSECSQRCISLLTVVTSVSFEKYVCYSIVFIFTAAVNYFIQECVQFNFAHLRWDFFFSPRINQHFFVGEFTCCTDLVKKCFPLQLFYEQMRTTCFYSRMQPLQMVCS